MTRVVPMAGAEPGIFLDKRGEVKVRIVVGMLQAREMIGDDIVDSFDVVGFNAHRGKHEAVCEKAG